MLMDFDHDEKRRRQFIKVLIAELAMVIAVIAIVIVATLASMGFFVNSEWTIEQSGLLQLHSLPTGASVELDGETLFFRTNLSRTMAEGSHTLKLTRDGYDSWQKTINMRPGVLLRVYYPRLFLQNRTATEALKLGKELAFYAASRDRSMLLYAEQGAVQWNLVEIKGDEIRETVLDLEALLPGVEAKKFTGKVQELKWSNNSDRVLVKIAREARIDWLMLDLKDPKSSLNLSETFGMDFAQIELVNGSMGQLFVLRDHQLYRIDVADHKMSGVLLNNIESFASYGANLIYLARANDSETDEQVQQVGVYKDGEKGGTIIATLPIEQKVEIALTNYYDQDYIAYTVDDKLTIYSGKLPTYNGTNSENDLSALELLIDDRQLTAIPATLTVSPNGEYIVAQKGQQYIVADMETGDLYEYEAPVAELSWFDDSMMYGVWDQKIEVWDFDFANRRVLVNLQNTDTEDTKDTEEPLKLRDYQVVVASNDRWLYYIVEQDAQLVLMRERIRD